VRLRLDLGLILGAAAGVLLLLLMFSGWFNLQADAPVADDAVGVGMGRSFDAWVSFDWIDLYLLAMVAVALALPVLAARRARLPVKAGAVLIVLGAGACLLILYRLVFPPWDGAGREAAPFLALLCAAAIVAAGLLSNHLVAVDLRRRKASAGRTGPGR
jgi:hypothetical protein